MLFMKIIMALVAISAFIFVYYVLWPIISYWIDKFKRSRPKSLPKKYNNIFNTKLYVYNYMCNRIEFVGNICIFNNFN